MRSAALLALMMLSACSSLAKKKATEDPDPRDRVIAEQRAQISQLERRLAAADEERRGLFAQLGVAEQRVGLRPFNPRTLKRLDGDMRLEPGRVTVLRRPRDRGKKTEFNRFASQFPRYVVAYWATWCKPCTSPEELAALRRLEGDLDRLGSALFGVAVDDLQKVRGHPRADEWHYPVWQRDDAHIAWLPKAFIDRVGLGLPLFLVVSGDGKLLYWRSKPLDREAHEELLTAAVRPR